MADAANQEASQGAPAESTSALYDTLMQYADSDFAVFPEGEAKPVEQEAKPEPTAPVAEPATTEAPAATVPVTPVAPVTPVTPVTSAPVTPAAPVAEQNWEGLTIDQLIVVDPEEACRRLELALMNVDGEIDKAINEGEIIESQKLQRQATKLSKLKEYATKVKNDSASVRNEIYRLIPDLDQRGPHIETFVNSLMGPDAFTQQEFSMLTNPQLMGRTALKVTKLVATLHSQMANLPKAVEPQKAQPETLNRPGSGTTGPSPESRVNASKLKEEALASDGDPDAWANWIGAITTKKQ